MQNYYPPVNKDEDNLKVLMVCHYVMAGLSLLALLFLYAHYVVMSKIMKLVASGKTTSPEINIEEVFGAFSWIYLVGGAYCIISAVGNFLSANYIRKRKARVFSLIMSGMNCLQMPLGIVLGIFTIIVLVRDSVVLLYEDK